MHTHSIINLTQHTPTPEQRATGVVDLPERNRKEALSLLTFNKLPSRDEILACAVCLAEMAVESECAAALIGGAPYLMGALESALLDRGIEPVYSFSERVSSEETQPDGTVRKINVFRHVGFVHV